MNRVSFAPAQNQQENYADVVITHNDGSGPICTISDDQLAAIKKRIKKLLKNGIEKGFGEFPINRKSLLSKIVGSVLNQNSICKVLTASSGATKQNHNELRNKYKGGCLKPKEALERGVAAKRLPLEPVCPENYDWANSPVYNGVDSCQDVVDEIDDNRIPVIMYTVNMEADEVQNFLSLESYAPFYTNYANSGLIKCKGDSEETFHKITILPGLPALKYVLHDKKGEGWSAWQLRRSCAEEDGTVYEAGDLMLDFGMRVMAPITVSVDGEKETRTIVISSVAAAGTSVLAELVPSWLPYQRLIGGEFAKKLLLEAQSNGWDIAP